MQILTWNQLDESARKAALARAPQNRSDETRTIVADILEQVRRDGDKAVRELTAKLDRVDMEAFMVGEAEVETAIERLNLQVREALDKAYVNIRAFHAAGAPKNILLETVPGVVCQARYVGIDRVGLYAPGGATPLPSSVLMMGVPAQLAGCRELILCTSPSAEGTIHPAIAYAARICNVTSVFRIGGAQAIAAMAFGTETVPACDKLFGPGSIWVTEAKRQVAAGDMPVTIDMAAGPSEVMLIADEKADPGLVAIDMAAQLEHGSDSQALLVTTSNELAERVSTQLGILSQVLSRKELIDASMKYSRVIIAESLSQAVQIANQYAAEHLIIQTEDPESLLGGITAAGSVFLGQWTPEVLGDYCSGTNHVLPTCGLARSVNGLSVTDFMKRITVQQASSAGLQSIAHTAMTLAQTEKLTAHAMAVAMREEKIESGVQS